MDAILGGSKEKSKPQLMQSPELASLKTPLAALMMGLMGQSSGRGMANGDTVNIKGNRNPLGGIPGYTGQTTAPIGRNESALLRALMGEGGDRSKFLNRTMGGAGFKDIPRENQLREDLWREDMPDQAQFLQGNPFAQASIAAAQRQTREALLEDLERALPGRFTAAGQFTNPGGSSAFDRAAAVATRGAASSGSSLTKDSLGGRPW